MFLISRNTSERHFSFLLIFLLFSLSFLIFFSFFLLLVTGLGHGQRWQPARRGPVTSLERHWLLEKPSHSEARQPEPCYGHARLGLAGGLVRFVWPVAILLGHWRGRGRASPPASSLNVAQPIADHGDGRQPTKRKRKNEKYNKNIKNIKN